jgi:hypothetical protein
MLFGVFDLVNLNKATPATGKGRGRARATGTVVYQVMTRNGKPLLYRFYPNSKNRYKNISYIPQFLANMAANHQAVALVEEGRKIDLGIEESKPVPLMGSPLRVVGAAGAEGLLDSTNKKVANQAAKLNLPPLVITTVADIAKERLEDEGNTKTEYLRIGEEAHKLDRAGYEMATALRQMDRRAQEFAQRLQDAQAGIAAKLKRGEPPSLTELENKAALAGDLELLRQTRDELMVRFNKRPLSARIASMVAVEDEINQLRAEGRQWIRDNPQVWDKVLARYEEKLAEVTKKNKILQRKKKPLLDLPVKPGLPSDYVARIYDLKEKLKYKKGKTVSVTHGLSSPGKGQTLVIQDSPEVGGLTPEDGALAYMLTAGGGPIGVSGFSRAEVKAIESEFSGRMNRIINGRSFGSSAPGWANTLHVKTLQDDLRSALRQKMFECVRTYTPAMAQRQVEEGRNFLSYLTSQLDSTARHVVRSALRHAQKLGKVDPSEAAAVAQAVEWGEGEFTREQLRDTGLPLASGYASAEDLESIQDFQKVVTSKLGFLTSLGMLSKLNIHMPMDNPDGEAGMKSWDSTARDVVQEYARRGVTYSKQFIKQALVKRIGSMFEDLPEAKQAYYTPGAHTWRRNQEAVTKENTAAAPNWLRTLSGEEMFVVKEGLRSILRLVEHRQVSVPGTDSWKVTREPTPREPGKNAKPGVSKPYAQHEGVHIVLNVEDPTTLKHQLDVVTRQIKPTLYKLKKEHEKAANAVAKLAPPSSDKEAWTAHQRKLQALHDKYHAKETEVSAPLNKLSGEIQAIEHRQHIRQRIENPTEGHSTPALVLAPEVPKTVPQFWAKQKRQGLDPAAELGLAMDVRGPSTALTANMALQQLRAQHYAGVWRKLDRLSAAALQKLGASREFKKYEETWNQAAAFSSAAAATQAAWENINLPVPKEAQQKLSKLKARPRAPLRYGGVSVENVLPLDVLKMASLLVRQRQSAVSKAESGIDAELQLLLLKLRRLLKVA